MPKKEKTKAERSKAQTLSAEIDRMLSGGPGQTDRDPLIETAYRLGQINVLLPTVPKSLEQRVAGAIAAAAGPQISFRQRIQPALWGAMAATVVLLLLWTITPGGRMVLADMLSTLHLGQTWITVTPTSVPADVQETPSLRELLPNLAAVEAQMGRPPAVPQTLPGGYELTEITAVSYPDLPALTSQPFLYELCYGHPEDEPAFYLKEYRLALSEFKNISGIDYAGDIVMEQVSVSGIDGALLTATGKETQYILVWERDGLLLELQSTILSKEELLDIAQTVR
ncbi:MAG: DUF4367 domain-containing protein [Anaerolineae bacterium]|nr:DUF4367 domain-containing protein [Anaerolineae bacterium]